MIMKRALPFIAVTIAMIIWGGSSIASKQALMVLPPLTMVSLRFACAIVLMLCVGLLTGSLNRLDKKDLPLFLFTGFIQPFAYYIIESYGLRALASPTIAEVELSTEPLIAPILAYFIIKEKITLNNIIGILISTAGVLLMIFVGSDNFEIGSPWGFLLLFGAVMIAAIYSITLKKIPEKYNDYSTIFYVQLFGFMFFIPTFCIVDLPHLLSHPVLTNADWTKVILSIGYLSIFASIVAYVLFCYAIRKIGVTLTNAFNNIRPVFTALIMLLLFHEHLPWQKWVAMLIVIVGLYICQLKKPLLSFSKNKATIFALVIISVFSFSQSLTASPKREMRAAWIATVANIDWPKQEHIGNTEKQKADMISMLNRLQALHFNTVIFQVRPTADALYYSDLEPFSHWVSGKQGIKNDTCYDPLEFVVQEAHKRCIDVHVWLNPYRVTNKFDTAQMDSSHIFFKHKEWFWKYGDKWYFDPGLDQTRQWLCKIVEDIVHRYDIDAVHFDDYFYPYPIGGKPLPDRKTFEKYPRGFSNINDWRRNNVNLVIQELSKVIKKEKPWVEFGISPFGVWRNKASDPQRGSDTQAGIQNYDNLYADILLWMNRGWIDYVMPQLYWEIGKTVADYKTLAYWWAENTGLCNLYIGHFASQLTNKKAALAFRTPNEICRQLRLNSQIPQIQGSAMYSSAPMLKNPQGILDSLKNNFYANYALPPIRKNLPLHHSTLAPRNLQLTNDTLYWQQTDSLTAYFVVYRFPKDEQPDFDNPRYIYSLTRQPKICLKGQDLREVKFCITAINRYKQESLPCTLSNYTY